MQRVPRGRRQSRTTTCPTITTATIQGLVGAQIGVGFFSNDIAVTHRANYFFYMLILAAVGMAVATYFVQVDALNAIDDGAPAAAFHTVGAPVQAAVPD